MHTPTTLYGIVSISLTAEGLATRDCAGLSQHRPDFAGYKGSRLPLVSNSVLDKKNLLFEKKNADYHNRKNCSSAILNTELASQKQKAHTRQGAQTVVIITFTIFSFLPLCNGSLIGQTKESMPKKYKERRKINQTGPSK